MLNAIIELPDNGDLFKVFSLEDKDFGGDRASYEVSFNHDFLKVSVTAKDSVALRSVLNTVTKIITVYEKATAVAKGEK